MGDVKVQAKGATKRFFRKGRDEARDFDAVSGVDLDLRAGELVVLKGRSGSGKSTLLNMVAGLLEPSEGVVSFEGRDMYALGDEELSELRNRAIGVIPQGHTALHSLTVIQNVMLPSLMYRSDDLAEKRAFELLEQLDIHHLADSYPPELSGGEVRRVAVARALMCEPAVILADEPTGDLDDANTEVVLSILRAYADAGTAVLLVTHEKAADNYADRILRMDAGKLAEP